MKSMESPREMQLSNVTAVGLRADGRLWVGADRVGQTRRDGVTLVLNRNEARWVAGRLLRYLEGSASRG